MRMKVYCSFFIEGKDEYFVLQGTQKTVKMFFVNFIIQMIPIHFVAISI